MPEPGSSAAAGGALALKFGLLKGLAAAAALLGAFLMAAVFEPKTKREMMLRAFVALGSSLLFTGWAMKLAARYFEIPLHSLDPLELIEFTLTVGGLLGALSWFAFGAAGEVLKNFRKRPIQTLQEVGDAAKSVRDGGGDVPYGPDGEAP